MFLAANNGMIAHNQMAAVLQMHRFPMFYPSSAFLMSDTYSLI